MEDPRAEELAQISKVIVMEMRATEQHRNQRDQLIRELRAADPKRWSYPALARIVGCSESLIAVIVREGTQ